MWVGVLGPTVVEVAGRPVAVAAAKHRALLAALALADGRPAPAASLVAALWGEDPPASAAATLQTYVSQIRRLLEPDLPPRSPSSYLSSSGHGYLLHARTDAAELTAAVTEAAGLVAGLGTVPVAPATDVGPVLDRLTGALALWRGEPYADLPASDAVDPERARLEEVHLLAREQRAALLVAAGRDAEAVAGLEALTRAHPLRERPWTLLATALARTGRQADGLAVLDRLRRTLDDELGIEPSGAVRELQTTILRQELPAAAATLAVSTATTATAPPPPAGPPDPAMPAPPEPARVVVPPWPLVGRDTHLAGLTALLDGAVQGRAGFAAIVGDAGAGKTRLGAELALRAQAADALVLIGRCSQEEDAPPLWPWTSALGLAPRVHGPDHDAARFAVAEEVRRALSHLARDRTVLLGLEDLHWADASSLRVLRHLCTHVEPDLRLLVVATWRPSGEAEPALAETAAALARQHALRIDLGGLSADETAALLDALTGDGDPALAGALHRRTEGNPFFLVEYGRLARSEERGLAEVVDDLPSTVAAVVNRRIAQLPPDTAAALTSGAAIGREFGLDLLAPALGRDELEVLDLLEPAVTADLVQDLGGDRFRFVHALVREAAYDALAPSRRERLHATLAGLVEQAPDNDRRAAELARHWEAAGPRHVRAAHLAAAAAGDQALAAHATDEARDHLATALRLLEQDPSATVRERVDLLVRYADACRWSTRRLEMHAAADEAVVLAGSLGDTGLVVAAASVASRDALWPARAYGEWNADVVETLRATLAGQSGDSEVHCRLLLALATEAYYCASAAELDAWSAEAIAMARRLGDDTLLLSALAGSAATGFRRSTAPQRRAWCEEGIDLAGRIGDERTRTHLRILLATTRCELGDVDGLVEEVEEIARTALDDKLYFVEMVALTFLHSWAAMGDDQERIATVFGRLIDCFDLVSTAHKVDTVQGAALFVPLWDPKAPMPSDDTVLRFLEESAMPIGPAAAVLALRHGLLDEARATVETFGVDLDTDNWFSMFVWATGAELAVGLGMPDLGAAAYARLLPYRGTCIMSGTSPFHGPVDCYLALAAAGTGELGTATRYADSGLAQVRAWQLPRVERWFLDQRERHGF
ncbi:BTAD domain-containing putative transcriptional regulator [Nocardioides sp. J54]|uniref:BTAD domain-containing putative transcriptional regulator n=1 Tax=Nocardioides sp. J54 TaxID=935866 RepID=UPI0004901AEE|nr:BTAD domain-containing putative transcriptional regulator [Nocardioides sp. J54]